MGVLFLHPCFQSPALEARPERKGVWERRCLLKPLCKSNRVNASVTAKCQAERVPLLSQVTSWCLSVVG